MLHSPWNASYTRLAPCAAALAAELDCLQRVADLGPDALLAALPLMSQVLDLLVEII